MYEAHRVVQSFEMSQFIRNTSETCDFVIVGGDFNFRPDQIGYKIIRSNANLFDSWIERVSVYGGGRRSYLTRLQQLAENLSVGH